MSEGQKDIARQTRLLKDEIEIPLVAGQYTYDLPEDLWLIIRVVYNDRVIELKSHEEMDQICLGWFSKFAKDLHALIYDKRDLHKIRTYPIPNDEIAGSDYEFSSDGHVGKTMNQSSGVMTSYDSAQLNQLEGVLTSLDDASMDSVYGVVSQLITGATNIQYDDPYLGIATSIDGVEGDSPYGAVVDIDFDEDYEQLPDVYSASSDFGVITNLRDITSRLRVYYIKDAPEVQLESDSLVIPSIFDTALKYYIIAKAYADDIDAQYQTKSDRSMLIYQREVDTIGARTSRHDGTRSTQYSTMYRGAF